MSTTTHVNQPVLPLCSAVPSWPSVLVTHLLQGTPIDNINVKELSALLQRLPPPYHVMRYNGDTSAAFQAAWSAFRRLHTCNIQALSPLDVEGCGNRFVAKASVDAVRKGRGRDLECVVISHLVQVKGKMGVAGSNNLSNFFMEDYRMDAHVLHSAAPAGVSPNAFWRTHGEVIINTALEHIKKEGRKMLHIHHLSVALFKLVGVCTAFRPMVARHLYQGAVRVLDMCGGWGDRLLAMLSVPSICHAVVVDPENKLHERYKAMRQAFRPKELDPDFQLTTITSPFEDLPLPRDNPQHPVNACGPYCVAFTSPPFFNRETYGSSKKQSLVRYPDMQQWIHSFLIPMARCAFARIRKGGLLALAMCDFRDAKAEHKGQFTADVIEAMAKREPDAMFRGVILFSLLGKDKTVRHKPQPIFVWQRQSGNFQVDDVHPVFQHNPTRHKAQHGLTQTLNRKVSSVVPVSPRTSRKSRPSQKRQRRTLLNTPRPNKKVRNMQYGDDVVVEM